MLRLDIDWTHGHIFIGLDSLPCLDHVGPVRQLRALDPEIPFETTVEGEVPTKGILLELLIKSVTHGFNVLALNDFPASARRTKDPSIVGLVSDPNDVDGGNVFDGDRLPVQVARDAAEGCRYDPPRADQLLSDFIIRQSGWTRGILTLAKSRWKHGELTKPGNGAHGNQRKQQESHKVLLNSIDKATET